jgi:LmbE family N-acetylglucosaminyl deacetylase
MAGRQRTVLGFFAHPDDEAYSVGGTLARCAQAGARVVVVTATAGEGNGEPSVREAELRASCELLGAAPPVLLGWPDGGVESLAADRARAELVAVLEAERPDVLLSLGADGAYGHVDHLACTRLLTWAAAALDWSPRLLHVAFEQRLFEPVRRGLRRKYGPGVVAIADPELLGVPEQAVDLSVPIAQQAAIKRAAIAAHRSQLTSERPLVFLAPGLVEALLERERFQWVRGPALPPGARDVLDGLD